GDVDAQRSARQGDETGCHGNGQPGKTGQQVSLLPNFVPHREGAAPPNVAVENLPQPKQQVIEYRHQSRGHQGVQQHGTFGTQIGVNPVHVHRLKYGHPDNHHPDHDQNGLNVIGTDHRIKPPKQGIGYAYPQDYRGSYFIGYPGNRAHQDPPGHAHADEPEKAVKDADYQKKDPGRRPVTQAHKISAGVTAGHKRPDPLGKRGKKKQPQRTGGVGQHSPDAQLQRKLRRQHGGVGGYPGSHHGGGSEGKPHVPASQHVAFHAFGFFAPVDSQADPQYA